MSECSILGALDAAHLQNAGLLTPPNDRGTRRVHKRRLNRSSDEENQDIPLDVHPQSAAAQDAFATIPDQLISRATLEYVGFSDAKADALWSQWTNWPPQGPSRETDPDTGGLQMSFLKYMTGAFNTGNDTFSDDDRTWARLLDTFGLSTETQQAILDPVFRYIRLSESCVYWAKDTVHMRYHGLMEIQKASRDRENALRRAVTRPGSGQPPGQSFPNPVHTPSSSSLAAPRSVSGWQQQSSPGISNFSSNSASVTAARNAPGFVTLFKSIDQGRIAGLLDDNGSISRIQTMLSSAPSDFSGRRRLYYFTPDFKVAQYYAVYAKRRTNAESVVIIMMSIPNREIKSLQEPEILRLFWPNPEWAQLVWSCRNGRRMPKDLSKYQEAALVIGTIARKPNSAYEELASPDDVAENYVLKVQGSEGRGVPATQYVFGEDGEEILATHGRIKIFPFVPAELRAWIEEYRDMVRQFS